MTVAFNVPTTFACGGTIQNQATVSTSTTDPVSSNNTSGVVSTTVTCPSPTFSITKTDGKTTAARGETLTYTIAVTNTSSVSATDVTVTDTLPGNVTFVSALGGSLAGNAVTFVVHSIAAGETVTRTVVVTINSGVANGTMITNTASIGTVRAQDTTTVQAGTAIVTVDLRDSKDPVNPGQGFIYTIRLTNISSTLASGIQVKHILDGDTEFLAASDNGTHSNGLITWTGVSVPANGTTSLKTTVRVRNSVQDRKVLNSTAISGSSSDAETTLVRDDDGGSNVGRNITITVRDSADPVGIEECFDEIITVRNGRGIRQSVDVTGFLDPDMDFNDANFGGRLVGNGRIEWQDIVIGSMSSVTLHATVCVDPHTFDGRNLQFRARAEGSEDTEYTRIIDAVLPPPIGPIPPAGPSIITVDKSTDREEVQPGSVVLYKVTIRNEGNTPSENLIVEDNFTAGTASVEDAGGGIMTGNGVTWSNVRVGAHTTRVLQYRVRVAASMRHGKVINNTVTVRGGNTVVTDTENVRVLSALPQTGGSGFLRGDTTARLRPREQHPDESTNLPLILWTQVLTMGLATGSIVGRKLVGW
ncbi:DUF11 domain-containing protein, partial [Candidatus Peribacteria bacterium]|nr:DUF11 domain-containing protein [Candidatus Peribacteria bacterium]